MKMAKVGNTILKFNNEESVKTEEEIKRILDSIAEEVQRSVIASVVKENTA